MLVEEVIPAIQTNCRALPQYIFLLLRDINSFKQLQHIHTQIIINGFTQKNFILVKLLSLYVSSGYLKEAHQIFDGVNCPSTTLWNQMIRAHSATQFPGKSIEVYNQMEAKPDEYTFSYVLTACAKAGALRQGMKFHGRVLRCGYCCNVFVQTSLVNLYCVDREGVVSGKARQMFDELSERNVVTWNSLLAGYVRWGEMDLACIFFDNMPERNVVSWTTMIAGLARNGKCKRALSLFRDMWIACVKFDRATLVAALSACAELGDLRMGRWIHSYIHGKLHVESEEMMVPLDNALVHMYASCGFIDDSFKVFKAMPKRSTISWTSMIMGFAKQGRGEEALQVFWWMQRHGDKNVRPDAITMIAVLSACSHAGLVEEGRYFFNCIQTWGIQPRIEHYGCMVDILSRAGLVDEAHRLVETMPIKPNDAVWGALLGGCKIHKNADLASHVAQKVVEELDPDQAAGYLVLLSNVYATMKRWQDVVDVRRMMVEEGVKKPPGRSWIQINGINHEFMAGKRDIKDAHLVCRKLWDVLTLEAHVCGAQLGIED